MSKKPDLARRADRLRKIGLFMLFVSGFLLPVFLISVSLTYFLGRTGVAIIGTLMVALVIYGVVIFIKGNDLRLLISKRDWP